MALLSLLLEDKGRIVIIKIKKDLEKVFVVVLLLIRSDQSAVSLVCFLLFTVYCFLVITSFYTQCTVYFLFCNNDLIFTLHLLPLYYYSSLLLVYYSSLPQLTD